MATDGAIPAAIDHDESAALHIGRGDLPRAMLAHFAADRESHEQVTKRLNSISNLRWYARGALAVIAGLVALSYAFGKDVASAVLTQAAKPMLDEQSVRFTDTVRATLTDFKASVDKSEAVHEARIRSLEERADVAPRRHR